MIKKNRAAPLRAKAVGNLNSKRDQSRVLLLSSVIVLAASVLVFTGNSKASGSSSHLESPRIDQSNEKSLQRGAKAFINYCMGCHTAGYQRYNRMAKDIGLSETDVEEHLIFTTDKNGEPSKVGSLMTNTMSTDYGKQAFGVVPPNLALTARSRGTDWIYSYLKSYYLDPEIVTTGVNNLIYPDTAMPHVLWELQGWQTPVYGEETHGAKHIVELELEHEGKLTPKEYDNLVADITNFMAYIADPIKQTRHKVGVYVLLFLFGLLALTYALKKEYWKDIV